MQIHQLKLAKRKKTKTIGRGGKRGTTSGRGTKGQGAHNKHKSPLFEGGRSSLIERMKKLRGDRKSTRLNSSHVKRSRMPSSA